MVKEKAKDIGYDVELPKKTCNDVNCPFHGKLPIRGKILEGVIVSDRMQGTAIVRRDYLHFISKYERYEKRKSRISAHNPVCVDAKKGNKVRIAECRPLSKTKHFVVIEKIN
ncbi:MAG: 30S ribosomal protein S17 [Candidatus Aenigmarchaeota archaeon]|nr:30S ribosomal protein S17 [Candidatus Aenigmarchaeota archaeon]